METVNSWVEKFDRRLHDDNEVTKWLAKAETITGIKRVYLVLGASSIIALYLVVGYGGQLITNTVGFVYPAYSSICAIESHNKNDDTKWLTYWVVFAAFSIVEFFSDLVLSWFPFYWLAKFIFLIWCFAPISFNGSYFVYYRLIRPVFIRNREKVDTVIAQAADAVNRVAEDAAKAAKEE